MRLWVPSSVSSSSRQLGMEDVSGAGGGLEPAVLLAASATWPRSAEKLSHLRVGSQGQVGARRGGGGMMWAQGTKAVCTGLLGPRPAPTPWPLALASGTGTACAAPQAPQG